VLLSKELTLPKKGKQIWPAETRPAVHTGFPAPTQLMSLALQTEFTERMLHQLKFMGSPYARAYRFQVGSSEERSVHDKADAIEMAIFPLVIICATVLVFRAPPRD